MMVSPFSHPRPNLLKTKKKKRKNFPSLLAAHFFPSIFGKGIFSPSIFLVLTPPRGGGDRKGVRAPKNHDGATFFHSTKEKRKKGNPCNKREIDLPTSEEKEKELNSLFSSSCLL